MQLRFPQFYEEKEKWMDMSDGYRVRSAAAEDAAVVAEHRSAMFADMQLLSPVDRAAMRLTTEPWIFGLLSSGDYKGWLVEREGEVVAGGGLHLSQCGPLPGCLREGLVAHIANVYTLPSHRRLGLARRLIEEMLRWSRENEVHKVTLEASVDGRRLYEALGFLASNAMSLTL